MYRHRLTDDVEYKIYFNWLLLSFLAGNINVGGFLSCARFVSHVTGFATMAGVIFERGHFLEAIGTLSIFIFFIMGVITASLLTEYGKERKHRFERYAVAMLMVAFLLTIVFIGGSYGFFGEFGQDAVLKHDYILLSCLSGACGLQNGAITSISGATIRTTHLTGIATDLGISLVRTELEPLSPHQRKKERHNNLYRLLSIISFTAGSAIGAIIYVRYQYNGFLVPIVIALYFVWLAQWKARQSAQPAI